MIQLSIVIPVIQESAGGPPFEATLASVLGNRPPNSEVIVVTAGEYDDPYELADEVEFVAAEPATGHAELLNAGFQRARGKFVHVLMCGAEVEEGWTEPALEHFEDPTVASVAPLVLLPPEDPRVAAAGLHIGIGLTRRLAAAGKVWEDSMWSRTRVAGPTLTAAFFRQRAISQVGGVDPTVGPIFADVDLSLSFEKLDLTTRLEPSSRVVGEVSTAEADTVFNNAQYHERLFWKHRCFLVSLPWHFLLVSVELLWSVPRGRAISILAGRLYGMLAAPFDRRTRRCSAARSCVDHAPDRASEQAERSAARSRHHHIRKTAA